MDRGLAYFGKVTRETDNSREREFTLARAWALEREFTCGAPRAMFPPSAAFVNGDGRPNVSPEGIKHALGIIRNFSRIAEDAARVESRYPGATYGFLAEFSFVQRKGPVTKVDHPAVPAVSQPAQQKPQST